MPYKGERPLLMRMVISLFSEILNNLRASPPSWEHVRAIQFFNQIKNLDNSCFADKKGEGQDDLK